MHQQYKQKTSLVYSGIPSIRGQDCHYDYYYTRMHSFINTRTNLTCALALSVGQYLFKQTTTFNAI